MSLVDAKIPNVPIEPKVRESDNNAVAKKYGPELCDGAGVVQLSRMKFDVGQTRVGFEQAKDENRVPIEPKVRESDNNAVGRPPMAHKMTKIQQSVDGEQFVDNDWQKF
uniref:Calponin-homology (CH) domain-containing protein n=1 Tax=Globodera pallida TaxID=36090 RepID=A0A183CAH6_GLOPA